MNDENLIFRIQNSEFRMNKPAKTFRDLGLVTK
jgi:hypothetical protein